MIRSHLTSLPTQADTALLSTHLEHLCGAEDALYAVLVEVGDPFVHELEEDLEVLVVGALQDHDQLPVQRGVAEQLGEVRAAGRQNQSVRLE